MHDFRRCWIIAKEEGAFSNREVTPLWLVDDLVTAQEMVTKLSLIANIKPEEGHYVRSPSNEDDVIFDGHGNYIGPTTWVPHPDPYGKHKIAYRALLAERADGLTGEEQWSLHEVEKL